MSEELVKSIVVRVIGRIAPEAPVDNVDPNLRFRDQFAFDSVDFLNFALALQEELKIQIPEYDYPQLATLKGCTDYLSRRMRMGSSGDELQ